MKSALVVCFTDLRPDARVTRQINFLKGSFDLTVVCLEAYPDSDVEFVKVKKPELTLFRKLLLSFLLLSRLDKRAYYFLHDYRTYVPSLRERQFDLIVANDFEALPFAFDVAAPHTRVFFDAHEYAPRQFEDRLYWRIFFQRFTQALCAKYIPRVHGMSTINRGIAEAYEKNFGVESIIITNASDYHDLRPVRRETYPIRLVHHGIFNVSRQPEIMLEMMAMLDERFTLDLIYLLPGHSSAQTVQYFESFKQKAEQTGRIRVLPPLKSAEIVPALNSDYDMGIILVPPVNFNYENGLPNKLFECIQARIGMAVGPLREIANVVRTYGIGVVSEDFTAQGMAKAISVLTLDELNGFKVATNEAASKMNAQLNRRIMLDAIQKMF